MVYIVVIGLVIFLSVLLFLKIVKTKKATTIKQYFLADKETNSDDFINSTVAYGYQIAALALFASWGYIYGFWTVWVPIFWGIGFWLLRFFNNKGYLDNFYKQIEESTIHGFIAKMHKSKKIAIVAAFASMIGLSGTAFFEAEFTSDIIATTVAKNPTYLHYIIFLFFVLIALFYILRGGLKTVIETDKLQLKIGFITFNIFVIYIFIKTIQNGYLYTGGILFILSFIAIIILNLLYPKLKKLFPSQFNRATSSTLLISFLCYIIALAYTIAGTDFQAITVKDSFTFFVKEQQIGNIFSLGWLSMISLLLANGLWQFVDISSWQRLASLNQNISRKEISKSLSLIALYSPLTWIIAIFFGMSLRYVGVEITDVWNALKEFISISTDSGNFYDKFFILTLLISTVFIMFSTLDSLISSISYTTFSDIILVNKEKEKSTLKGARFWTIFYTIVFMFLYALVRYKVSGIDSILYTFYSFQLALFPAIIMIFLSKKINPIAAFASIIGGSIFTLIPLFINSDTINPYSASAIFSVIGAFIIYFAFQMLFRKKDIIVYKKNGKE